MSNTHTNTRTHTHTHQHTGVRPPSNKEGVLQDVHWSGGAFGYFPSYSLGAMIATQVYIIRWAYIICMYI